MTRDVGARRGSPARSLWHAAMSPGFDHGRLTIYTAFAGVIALGVGSWAAKLVAGHGSTAAIGVHVLATTSLAALSGYFSQPVLNWALRPWLVRDSN
jgi:hypothetical protein